MVEVCEVNHDLVSLGNHTRRLFRIRSFVIIRLPTLRAVFRSAASCIMEFAGDSSLQQMSMPTWRSDTENTGITNTSFDTSSISLLHNDGLSLRSKELWIVPNCTFKSLTAWVISSWALG